MSKKRHNFFRLCSLVLAFMLTFTNMPAVAYATDGYSAEALVEDTAEASENDAITEDGEIEESEPAVSDDELPAEDPAEDAEAAEEAGEAEELDDNMELFDAEEDIEEEDYILMDAENQKSITFNVDGTNTVVYANTGTHIDPVAVPQVPLEAKQILVGWTEKSGETETVFYTNEQIKTMPLTESITVYPVRVYTVSPYFNAQEIVKTYGDADYTYAVAGAGTQGTVHYEPSAPAENQPEVVSVDGTGKVTILNAGTTTITATVSYDKVTYDTTKTQIVLGSASYTLKVNKKTVKVGVKSEEKTYDGEEKTPQCEVVTGTLATGDRFGTVEYIVAGDKTIQDAGTYNVSIKPTSFSIVRGEETAPEPVTSNYELTYAAGEYKINPAPVTLVWPTTPFRYTGNKVEVTVSIDPAVEGITVDDITVATFTDEACTESTGQTGPVAVGTYYAKATIAAAKAKNFELTNEKSSFTIIDTMVVEADNISINYDGETHTVGLKSVKNSAGPLTGYTVMWGTTEGSYDTGIAPSYTDAIKTTVYYKVSYEGYDDVTGSISVEIKKIDWPETMTVSVGDWKYGATANTPSVSNDNGGTVTYYWKKSTEEQYTAWAAGAPSDIADYDIKAEAAATTNYNGVTATNTFKITKGDTVVTKDPEKAESLTYSGSPQNLLKTLGETSTGEIRYYYKKWVNDTTSPESPTTADKSRFNKNQHTATESGKYNVYYYVAGGDYYEDSLIKFIGTVTIAKASVGTPKASVTGWEYGSTASTPSITTYQGSGAVTYYYNTSKSTENSKAWSTIGTADPGTYYIYAVIAETDNYNSYTTAFGDGDASAFTISKKTVHVIAENKEMTFGNTVPSFTAKIDDNDKVGDKNLPTNWTYGFTVKNEAGNVVTITNNTTPGTYYIYVTSVTEPDPKSTYYQHGSDYTSTYYTRGTLTIKKRKLTASEYTITKPVTYDNLEYTGQEQKLIETAGFAKATVNAQDYNLSMLYSIKYTEGVGMDPADADFKAADNIKGKEAKRYAIYYYVPESTYFEAIYYQDATATAPAEPFGVTAGYYVPVTISKSTPYDLVAPTAKTKWDLHYNNTKQAILATNGSVSGGTILFSYDYKYNVGGYEDAADLQESIDLANFVPASEFTFENIGEYPIYYYVQGGDNYENLYEVTTHNPHTLNEYDTYNVWTLDSVYINPSFITIKANDIQLLYGQSWENELKSTVKPDYGFYYDDKEQEKLGIRHDKADGNVTGNYKVQPISVHAKAWTIDYYYNSSKKISKLEEETGSKTVLVGNYAVYDFIEGTLTIEPAPVTVTVADAEKDFGTKDKDVTFTYASIDGLQYGESEDLIPLPKEIVRVSEKAHAYYNAEDPDTEPEEAVKLGDNGKTVPYESVLFAVAMKDDVTPYEYVEGTVTKIVGGETVEEKTGVWQTKDLAKELYNYQATHGTIKVGNYMVTYVAGNFTINNSIEVNPVIADPWDLHYDGTAQSIFKKDESGNPIEGTAFDGGTIKFSKSFVPDPNGYEDATELDRAISKVNDWVTADALKATDVGSYGTYYYYVAGEDGKNSYLRYFDEDANDYRYTVWPLGWTYMNPAVLTVATKDVTLLYGQSWENAFVPVIKDANNNVIENTVELLDLFGFKYNKAQGNIIGIYGVTPEAVKATQCDTPYYIDKDTLATEYGHPTYQAGNYLIKDYIPGTLTIEPAPVTVTAIDTEKTYHTDDPDTFEYKVEGMQYGEKDTDLFTMAKMPNPVFIRTDASKDWDAAGELVTVDKDDVETPHENVLRVEGKADKFTVDTADGRKATPNNATTLGYSDLTKGTELVGNYLVTYVSGHFTINYGTVVVDKAPQARDLTYTQAAWKLVTEGTVKNEYDAATGTVKYAKVANGSEKPALTAFSAEIPEETNPETWDIYWYVDGNDKKYKDTVVEGPLTTTISNNKAVIATKPEKLDRVYDGDTPKALITEGQIGSYEDKIDPNRVIAVTGTMKYAYVPKAETEKTDWSTDKLSWSTEIPKESEEGTYVVYFKADGLDQYFDPVSAEGIDVSITPADNVVVSDIDEEVKTHSKVAIASFEGYKGDVAASIVGADFGSKLSIDGDELYLISGSRPGTIEVLIAINTDAKDTDYDVVSGTYNHNYKPVYSDAEGKVDYTKFSVKITSTNEDPYAYEDGTFKVSFLYADDYVEQEDGSEIAEYVYTGTAIKPQVRVTNGVRDLVLGKDYKLSYKNNTNVPTNVKKLPTVVITGMGDYKKSVSLNFIISPKSILDEEEVFIGNTTVEYNKKAAPIVTYKGKILKAGKDYDLTPVGKITSTSGTVDAKIVGKNNFYGERPFEIQVITPRAFKANLNTNAINFIYNGDPKVLNTDPEDDVPDQLVVTDSQSGSVLEENKDYSVSYSNNVNAGTVTATITGMGLYKTKVTKKFKIQPAKNVTPRIINYEELYKEGVPFQNSGSTPDVFIEVDLEDYDGVSLTRGVDYKITYSNNKKIGYGKYKITYLGNYKGLPTKTYDFKINPAPFNYAFMTVTRELVYKASAKKAGSYFAKPGKNLFVTLGDDLLKTSEYSVDYYLEGSEKPLGKNDPFTLNAGESKKIIAKAMPLGANYSYSAELEKEGFVVTAEYLVTCPEANVTVTNISNAKIVVTDKDNKKVNPAFTGTGVTPGYKYSYNEGEQDIDDNSPYRVVMTIGSGKNKVTYSSDGLAADGKITDYFTVEFVNNVKRGSAKVIITPIDVDDELDYLLGTSGDEPVFVGSVTRNFTIGQLSVSDVIKNWLDKFKS